MKFETARFKKEEDCGGYKQLFWIVEEGLLLIVAIEK
jgi:hypothetical protein